MALAKNVEKRIWDVEGFAVTIKHRNGRDMRGDRTGLPTYDFERGAKNNMTVAEWKEQRFSKVYPGFDGRRQHAALHGARLVQRRVALES